MNFGEEFRRDRIAFLTKLYEMCDFNTNTPKDAFVVGRQLRFDEEKTARIVNYLLENRFIRKTQYDIPINTGDPPPQRKFLIVFITSQGIDELETEKPEVKASDI